MEIFKGTPCFAGIAIGRIHFYKKGEIQMHQHLVSNVKKEVDSFREAQNAVASQLKLQYEKTQAGNPELAAVNRRQLFLIEGSSYRTAIEEIILTQKVSAVYAIMTTKRDLHKSFGRVEDEAVKARLSDVDEVSEYLLEVLGGINEAFAFGKEPVILVSDDIPLAELMCLDKDKMIALVLRKGEELSPSSVFFRINSLPSILGVPVSQEWDGKQAIVDGYSGTLYLSPDEEEYKAFMLQKEADEKGREDLMALRNAEDETLDGKKVRIYANIGNPDDLGSILYYGAKGIGMLRSEFQYLGRDKYPKENELFLDYKKVAEFMGERRVVIRTADLGAQKQAAYLELPTEANPLMGNRGIRLSLDREKMFGIQLRAIYRASMYGNLAVMFPMLTSLEELDKVKTLAGQAMDELRERGIPFRELPMGIMVETPAAVMLAPELARNVDFLSLGTNDLTQYTLAMDRQNPALREKYNTHHIAVMRMIEMVVKAAHAEGKPVCLCGELASDVSLTGELLKLGIDEFSVVPCCVLPLRKAVREINLSKEA
ncbi:MAG: phosphoenolpyruvate--protein phosphotransferase [Blautia sp.]|nr:phosphoenolpyruvate--protein phosphotransferase [Blautia sp.]